MASTDNLRQDLDYVASAVRRNDRSSGVPSIYFMWAAIIAVGFALPDFAPTLAAPFWLVAGIGGGLLSWWLGERDARRRGVNDVALGRRYGMHWTIGGVGFFLSALPMITGTDDPGQVVSSFLLVAGLVYALAGVHLERPLLWSGLLMLASHLVLVLFAPPYTWSITGLVIAVALTWSGLAAQRTRASGGA